MTIEDAKTILAAYRGAPDDSDPLISHALALAEENSNLRSWLNSSRAFDETARAAVRGITPPLALKEEIFARTRAAEANRKIVSLALPGFALALAASIVVALGLYFFINAKRNSPAQVAIDQAVLKDFVIKMLSSQEVQLAATNISEGDMRAWLHGKRSPATFTIPAALADATRFGCQAYKVAGHRVSLMCFRLADGRIIHLFVARLKGVHRSTAREVSEENGVGLAAWGDGAFFYILADPAGLEPLKQLTGPDDLVSSVRKAANYEVMLLSSKKEFLAVLRIEMRPNFNVCLYEPA